MKGTRRLKVDLTYQGSVCIFREKNAPIQTCGLYYQILSRRLVITS